MTASNSLTSTVLASDLCIGCGICAHLAPGEAAIRFNPNGFLRPVLNSTAPAPGVFDRLSEFCPMAGVGPDEDRLAEEFCSPDSKRHPRLGHYLACYAGRVTDASVYHRSSSGGVGRWLIATLLEKNIIDAAAVVMPRQHQDAGTALFEYRIATTPAEVLASATSAYYPVEMSGVLDHIRAKPGRYAITALPCFAKGIRTLCMSDPVMRSRITVVIGTVCGHLKSAFYAELLGWQLGVPPADLAGINFRVKIPGCRANEKGVAAYSRNSSNQEFGPVKVQKLYGTNYGEGFFKYKACDYCDDVVAETADVSFGDAWLPQYLDRGTSLIIVRQRWIQQILESARDAGELAIEPLGADAAAQSQDAGLRHRREGLAYRLYLADQKGEWRPHKRVAAEANHLTERERSIHRCRMKIAELSIQAFSELRLSGAVSDFKRRMAPLLLFYKAHYGSILSRCIRRLSAWLRLRF
jgi:coenzyme F420 hydrogenase subunit beta